MIRKRGDKWTVRVYDGTASSGVRWVGSFGTEDEARAAEQDAKLGLGRSGRAKTVGEWADIWLRDYERPAPATQRSYRYAVKRIKADLGSTLLVKLDRPTARRMANDWPLSVTRAARTMFGDARRDGVVRENPFSELRMSQPKGRKDLDALTEREIVSLADASSVLGDYGTEFRALIIFLGYVGCRPGELCCIRRSDVDLRTGEVTIRFALDGQGSEKAPKNGKPRVVVVPPPAIQAIRTVPVRLDSPYLFHTATGKRLSKGSLSYAFRLVRSAWGQREDLPLYALRHAAATLLMERGLQPHVVANQLGHTDGGRLVQTLYGHPSERGMRDQVKMAFAGWVADQSQDTQDLPAQREVS